MLALLVAGVLAIEPAAPVESWFAPGGSPTVALVRGIDAAEESCLGLAYSFTSREIAGALARASQRGVRVRLVVDRGQVDARAGQAGRLCGFGIPVRVDRRHPIQHDKVLIVDGRFVYTGSFNWTVQAESNAENLVRLAGPAVAAPFLADWTRHWDHADAWPGASKLPRSAEATPGVPPRRGLDYSEF